MRQIAVCLPERSQIPPLSQPNDVYDHSHYSCGKNRVSARYFSKKRPENSHFNRVYRRNNNAEIKQAIQIGMGFLS
jgi:hypothetical protein